jgi:hypothetical protein
MTFACAGAGLDAGAALACAGGGVPAGFGFVRAWTAAGACVAFAVVLGFFADFSFSGVPVGADVAVTPCVVAGVPQDCHGQHIALAGSVRSINADTAKGTVNFALIEPLLFTVLSVTRKWPFLGLAHLLRSEAEAALIQRRKSHNGHWRRLVSSIPRRPILVV